jgi:hypothetical protein
VCVCGLCGVALRCDGLAVCSDVTLGFCAFLIVEGKKLCCYFIVNWSLSAVYLRCIDGGMVQLRYTTECVIRGSM